MPVLTLRFPSTNTQFPNFTKPGIDRPITRHILRFSGTFAMLMRPWTFPRTQRFRQWLLEPLISLSQRNWMWPLLIVVMLSQPSLLLLLGLLKKPFFFSWDMDRCAYTLVREGRSSSAKWGGCITLYAEWSVRAILAPKQILSWGTLVSGKKI